MFQLVYVLCIKLFMDLAYSMLKNPIIYYTTPIKIYCYKSYNFDFKVNFVSNWDNKNNKVVLV